MAALLNSFVVQPVNLAVLGEPYLFINFIPKALASSKTKQGLRVNDQPIEFNNCDANPNSYFVFFADYKGKTPNEYASSFSGHSGLPAKVLSNLKASGSVKSIPESYFTFMELYWGGCGAYAQTANGDPTLKAFSVGLS